MLWHELLLTDINVLADSLTKYVPDWTLQIGWCFFFSSKFSNVYAPD